MAFPRTVRFMPPRTDSAPGRIVLSDAERRSLFVFTRSGRLIREIADDAFQAPYLIGRRGDTLLVLSPRPRRLSFVAGGAVVRNVTLKALPPVEQAPLLWATASDTALFAKVVGEDAEDAIIRLNERYQPAVRHPLEGPRWHYAGPLQRWGDTLVSLSGFRPAVGLLPADLSRLDTLALVGFDSPMLARSRRFALGEVRQPPLLISGSAAAGGLLFLLNMRPGRLRLDVFGRDGRLRHRLTAPRETPSRDIYPRDVAVRHRPDGSYAIAIAWTAPRPMLRLYRWRPQGAVAPSSRTTE